MRIAEVVNEACGASSGGAVDCARSLDQERICSTVDAWERNVISLRLYHVAADEAVETVGT